MMEHMRIMMMDGMVMIKVLGLEKEKREKQNGLKAKVKSIGPFYFSDQDT